MKIGTGETLLMIGDSITDAGRLEPETQSVAQGLGYGYVAFVAALIGAVSPELGIKVINEGVDGNTVRDLKQRWKHDVLDARPDWLSVMIGINDVWRQFDSPDDPAQHVYLDEYTQTLEDLLKQSKSNIHNIVLLTPYYVEPDRNDPMRKMMDVYGARVSELAKTHGTLFVDIQSAFDKSLTIYKPEELADDKVHPNVIGHMIIARAFLQAIGFNWRW